MMASGNLPSLYKTWQAASSPRTKLLCAISTKRIYTKQVKKESNKDHHGGVEERAPSTAEEFQRVAQEKTRKTADKAQDAAIESAREENSSTSESVKKIANPGTQSSG